MPNASRSTVPERLFLFHAWAFVLAAGAALAAMPPGLPITAIGAAAALALALLVPTPHLPGLLVAALVVVSLAREAGLLPGLAPVLGVSRVTVALSGLVLLRVLAGSERTLVPLAALRGLLGYGLAMLVAVLAALLGATAYDGLPADLVRQAGYATAFGIGLVAAQDPQGRPRVFRALGWTAIVACSLACVYALWAAGRLPLGGTGLEGFFVRIRAGSAFSWLRSIVPFVDEGPNLSAVAFVALGAFVAPRLLLSASRRDALLGVALVLAVVAAVISTQSRTGLALLVVAPLPALAWASSRAVRAVVAACVAGALLMAAGSEHLLAERRPFSLSDPNVVARVALWRQAMDLIAASPIVGHGYGYSVRGPFVETIPAAPGQDWSSRPASVHSDYLGLLVDGGVLAASAFAVFLAALAAMALRLVRRGAAERPAGVGLLGLLAVLATAMGVGSIWQSPVVSTLAWLSLGIAAAEAARPLTGDAR